MNAQQSPTILNEPKPIAAWRPPLAKMVVASYGMGMWLLFADALVIFLYVLAGQHRVAAIIAGTLMVVGFAGTVGVARFAPRYFAVSGRETGQQTVLSQFLKRFRSLVGDGDFIQGIARRIDPGWQNSWSARNPEKAANSLMTAEVIHWAALIASIGPINAGLLCDYQVFAYVFAAANLVYNIFPILLIRDTRRRVKRICQRMSIVQGNAINGESNAAAVNEPAT